MRDADERRVAWILVGVIVAEGIWVLWSLAKDPMRLIHYLGFTSSGAGGTSAWVAAAAVAAAYAGSCTVIAPVRAYMWRAGSLKALATVAGVAAAVLEEVVFRKWLMDRLQLQGHGAAIQVLATGLAFGAGHMVWGLVNRSAAAAIHAMVATAVLGSALGVVYILAGRSLAPCIVAHFVIDALIEPGLLIAAVRGELGWRAAPVNASIGEG